MPRLLLHDLEARQGRSLMWRLGGMGPERGLQPVTWTSSGGRTLPPLCLIAASLCFPFLRKSLECGSCQNPESAVSSRRLRRSGSPLTQQLPQVLGQNHTALYEKHCGKPAQSCVFSLRLVSPSLVIVVGKNDDFTWCSLYL